MIDRRLGFLFLIVALSFVEPHRAVVIEKGQRLREFKRALIFVAIENKQIFWLVMFNAVTSSATFAIVWFAQPYMRDIGIPIAYFGLVWCVLHVWLGITALWSEPLSKHLGLSKTLLLIVVLTALSYLAIGLIETVWGVSVLFALYFIRGIRTPLIRDLINREARSDIRATVLSLSRFASSLVFAGLSPLLGWIADYYSLSTALIYASVIYLTLGLIVLWGLRR